MFRAREFQIAMDGYMIVKADTPPDTAVEEEAERRPEATRIQSVARAVRLIRLAAESPDGIQAQTAQRLLEVSLPTAYHLLNTLTDEGMLDKRDRRYFLGPLSGLIADAYVHQESIPPYLLEPLLRLSRELGETVTLCLWRNGGMSEVAVYEGAKPLQVGGRNEENQQDLHARASGKLMLAALSDRDLQRYVDVHPLTARTPNTITDLEALCTELTVIRSQGWAMEYEECDIGVACLAASVAAPELIRTAAYTLGAPAWRLTENRDHYLASLLAVSAEVSERRRSS
jgi:IclR family transcriptional regulator, acetate operon repressor